MQRDESFLKNTIIQLIKERDTQSLRRMIQERLAILYFCYTDIHGKDSGIRICSCIPTSKFRDIIFVGDKSFSVGLQEEFVGIDEHMAQFFSEEFRYIIRNLIQQGIDGMPLRIQQP